MPLNSPTASAPTAARKRAKITDMTPLEITLDKGTAGPKKIAVNQIRSVLFDDEPAELTQARLNAKNGGYATALERLEEVDLSQVERDLRSRRRSSSISPIAPPRRRSSGKAGPIVETGRKLNDFVRSHPQNFHYLEAVETMGDLLMASRQIRGGGAAIRGAGKDAVAGVQNACRRARRSHATSPGQAREAIKQFDAVLAASTCRQRKEHKLLGHAWQSRQSGGD